MSRSKLSTRMLALACAACVIAALLASCAPASQQKSPAQLNREYMSSVNRIGDEAADDLATFSEAVGRGDVAAMRLAAADASKTLSKIAELTPPEALAAVHEEYETGASELSAALDDYIALFASVQNGVSDASGAAGGAAEGTDGAASGVTEAALAQVQEAYQSGIDHLAKADALVAELAGNDAQASQDQAQGGQRGASGADAGQQ